MKLMVLPWQTSTKYNAASRCSRCLTADLLHGRATGLIRHYHTSLAPHLNLISGHLATDHLGQYFVPTVLRKANRQSSGYRPLIPPHISTRMAGDQKETIDLTGDSDSTLSGTSGDGDLHRAIALSLESMPTSPPRDSVASTTSGSRGGKHEPQGQIELCGEPAAMVGGILGIDRKRQEAERLARLKRKREHSISPPLIKGGLGSVSTHGDTGNHHGAASKSPPTESMGRKKQRSSPSQPTSNLQYPEGVVRKTWAFGFPRADDIKLEEVLQPSQLQAAVLSSFLFEWDWLVPKLDTQRTKFVFVVQAKDEKTKEQYHSDFGGIPNVRLCFPPMEGGVNCMHSKLMLLFYPTHLRIVVPTANLVPYDWGEPFRGVQGGVMENTLFLIDLPQRDSRIKDDQHDEIPFLQNLLGFLRALKLQKDVIEKVQGFDFSKLAQHAFVHSIGGSHRGDAWRNTGACGLGLSLQKLGLHTLDPIEVDFVTSSLGNFDEEFLRSLYLVAQGDCGLSEYTLRTAKSIPPGILHDLERRVGKNSSVGWRQRFRFYFPSEDTVQGSKGGPGCGGTICFNSRWWNGAKFPRNLIRDCQSQRAGMLMHNKVSQARLLRNFIHSSDCRCCRSGSLVTWAPLR